jgi:hypothetical protein
MIRISTSSPTLHRFGERKVADLGSFAALDLDCAARRVEDAVEFAQKAIAHRLEDAPGVFGDGGIEEFAPVYLQGTHRAFFVGIARAYWIDKSAAAMLRPLQMGGHSHI